MRIGCGVRLKALFWKGSFAELRFISLWRSSFSSKVNPSASNQEKSILLSLRRQHMARAGTSQVPRTPIKLLTCDSGEAGYKLAVCSKLPVETPRQSARLAELARKRKSPEFCIPNNGETKKDA